MGETSIVSKRYTQIRGFYLIPRIFVLFRGVFYGYFRRFYHLSTISRSELLSRGSGDAGFSDRVQMR